MVKRKPLGPHKDAAERIGLIVFSTRDYLYDTGYITERVDQIEKLLMDKFEAKGPPAPAGFSEAFHEAAQKKMAFVEENREKLVEAWLAETGLKPSESVLCQQEMGDGRTRMWIEAKE